MSACAGRSTPRVAVAVGAAGVVAVTFGWWVVGLPSSSAGAAVAVVSSGAAVAVVSGLRPAISRRDPVARSSALVWAALAVALGAWQLNAWLRRPREEHPTLSWLADAALDPRPVRAVAFVGWLAVAGWLARR